MSATSATPALTAMECDGCTKFDANLELMSRDPIDFLRDIEESCIRITDYTAGLSRDEVFTDKMRFDGILRENYYNSCQKERSMLFLERIETSS